VDLGSLFYGNNGYFEFREDFGIVLTVGSTSVLSHCRAQRGTSFASA
jgi:hypothetical protein